MDLKPNDIRIFFTGRTGGGKSSVVRAYAKNQFTTNYKATLGIDFEKKELVLETKRRGLRKEQILTFLLGAHARVGADSLVRTLPRELRKMICQSLTIISEEKVELMLIDSDDVTTRPARFTSFSPRGNLLRSAAAAVIVMSCEWGEARLVEDAHLFCTDGANELDMTAIPVFVFMNKADLISETRKKDLELVLRGKLSGITNLFFVSAKTHVADDNLSCCIAQVARCVYKPAEPVVIEHVVEREKDESCCIL